MQFSYPKREYLLQIRAIGIIVLSDNRFIKIKKPRLDD